jgi:hypothetical protein
MSRDSRRRDDPLTTTTHKYAAAMNLTGIDKRCDFCWSAPGPFRRYQCRNFESVLEPNQIFQSKGHWAACAACAEAVDRRDVNLLVLRACVGNYGEGNPFPLNFARYMRQTFELFYVNRTEDQDAR